VFHVIESSNTIARLPLLTVPNAGSLPSRDCRAKRRRLGGRRPSSRAEQKCHARCDRSLGCEHGNPEFTSSSTSSWPGASPSSVRGAHENIRRLNADRIEVVVASGGTAVLADAAGRWRKTAFFGIATSSLALRIAAAEVVYVVLAE